MLKDGSGWQFGFWSVMVLELVLKAAISKVAPVLIADNKEWGNIYFSLGHAHPEGKPKTAMMSELITRAKTIIPDFNLDMQNFCKTHSERRNSDVHSGALPFDTLKSGDWLPTFYEVCDFLLRATKKDLKFLFGADSAKAAQKMIAGKNKAGAQAVKKTIAKHKGTWSTKSEPERVKLGIHATLLATRNEGHRVKCPSCGSDALLKGSPSGLPNILASEDVVTVRTPMLPSHFSCSACGLKISGFAKLNAAGLGDTFTSTVSHNPIDFYGQREVDEWGGYDEDNNEP